MISALSAALFRWRRWILLASVALSVPLGAATLRRPAMGAVLLALMIPPLLAALIIANVLNRRQNRTLDIVTGPPSFGTPVLGSGPLFTAAGVFLLVAFAAWLGPAIGQGEDRWTLIAGLSLLTAVWLGGLRGAWSGCGVRLTAHGIDYRGPASTLTVPWEALDAVHPVESVERFAIRLRYARPDLIRATGVAFDRRTIRFEGADAHFLAAAIDCYARRAIGPPPVSSEIVHRIRQNRRGSRRRTSSSVLPARAGPSTSGRTGQGGRLSAQRGGS
ncbi:hypothetical protein [Catenuloplanes atrovinosus]|uniref:PH domain-containing protein n=1 Tax=Catenuloplanes atrovinosus TaxID=137266 RepID=A0AAE4CAB9_9ACTN|nr:hypothetical protein [Catenuloplanes atrovinosus]MDR7275669.1 hypothetical protein [Catenuloplanes atrovinosus]